MMRIDTFLKKAVHGKHSASVFLKEHRGYLLNFPRVAPILVALEKGDIFPTPALVQILNLLVLERDPATEEVEFVNPKTGEVRVRKVLDVAAKKKTVKKYQIFIFIDKGKDISEEIYEAAEYGEAERIAFRKLFHREDSCWADILGMGITTRVFRETAMKAILNGHLGGNQASKKVSKGTGSFSHARVKNSVSKFSGC